MTSLKPFDVANIIARNEGEEARLTIRNKMGNPTQIPVRLSGVEMENSTDGTTVTITSKVEYGYRTPDYEPRYLGKWDEKNKPEVPTAIDWNKLAKQSMNPVYGARAFGRSALITRDDLRETNELLYKPKIPQIKNVIHSAPATIVFWMDGTKTVVKAVNEEYDPEKGIAMAFVKKMFGNKGKYFNQIKKWLPEKVEKTEAKAEELPKETEKVEWFEEEA